MDTRLSKQYDAAKGCGGVTVLWHRDLDATPIGTGKRTGKSTGKGTGTGTRTRTGTGTGTRTGAFTLDPSSIIELMFGTLFDKPR